MIDTQQTAKLETTTPTPMKVLSVIAQKGGAGKTTLSLAVACAAAVDGLSAVVVDLDPQATAASWGDRRAAEVPIVIPAQPPRLGRILKAAAEQGVDLAVVDTAPRVEQSAVAAARAAHLVAVPCRPAVYDLETVAATRDLVAAVAPTTPVLCVLNGVPPRGPREPQARELLADIGVALCPRAIGLRAAVDYAAAAGTSAAEYEPRGKAAAEAAAVYRDLAHRLELPQGNCRDPYATATADVPPCSKDNLPTPRKTGLPTSRHADNPTAVPPNAESD